MSSKQKFIESEPESLAMYVSSVGRGVIAFDGRPGAGKSYLASMTAKRLRCSFLDADDFLASDTGMFIGALRIDDLRRAITSAPAQPVLLATVCARQVVERIGLTPSSIIWVE